MHITIYCTLGYQPEFGLVYGVHTGTHIARNIKSATCTLLYTLQPIQAKIMWTSCADLPQEGRNYVDAVTINGKVYITGDTTHDILKHVIDCYDLALDQWTQLPELPVSFFGLGRIGDSLVVVGGFRKNRQSCDLFTFQEDVHVQQWGRFAYSMPTARSSASVLSLETALLVAGGYIDDQQTDVVEIFMSDKSQWYRTDPLPVACTGISLTAIDNVCYAMGGWRKSHLNQCLSASIDDLFKHAVPANRFTHCGGAKTPSAWKTLPNTPTYQPGASVLAGTLLAVGG